ncbi:vacuolar protein 8 [Marchantia polymorpha subsp. ruderalis]|uniref:RING-type E3 ubiquitin transferase n=2 Tax=Marchantia polymorpha TaxID=3197 RepID=A0AAF6AUM6_MARPO|nr:hypothetical protein MARPO_0002s0200 [Marchantia polymorpha]BBN00147.1 hypothetical protein Mp_1g26780 [Marchantia polymorpha subsp. ruderalis]|eukprot:PTQ49737.1 hypothetical protein MARPO_0002s0200 [Marchantia polymorpha]
MVLELIPLGTLLTLLTSQVLETAVAAQDVLFEKESFRILSNFLQDIQPLLVELRRQDMKDSPAVRTALESLQDDLKKARTLIDTCTSKPKMYLLVNCRSIVRETQEITRNVGKSLELLALASAEVAGDISVNVSRLKQQMVSVKFQTSESKLLVINKLEQGLREHRTDQGFANDLLVDIARAVGIPVNASEISRELASFKREKEEAALRKEREEEAFMEQVITLLSRADSSYLPDSSNQTYWGRVRSIRNTVNTTKLILPLKSFMCPLTKELMVDPVSLVTGSCFERASITAWFAEGNTTDPVTQEELSDMTLRPNIPVRQSIEEWQERNYCIGILRAKSMLQSESEGEQKAALDELIELCQKNRTNKDWIVQEGLLVDIVKALKSSNRDIKRGSLAALLALVQKNKPNQELLVDAGALEQIVRCLGREAGVAKAAAALLLELLEGNGSMSLKIGRERSAILLLVTLLNGKDTEAAQLARLTLDKLSDEKDNVVAMANANWCSPLVRCLSEGKDDATKVVMANTLAALTLTDEAKTTMAEMQVVPPLVRMMELGKLETKVAAMRALQSLCSHRLIKGHIAKAGGVRVVLNHLLSGMSTLYVRENAAVILDTIAEIDGTEFFVDRSGTPLHDSETLENLLAVYENSLNNPLIRKHVLRTLLGLLSSSDSTQVRDTLRRLRGISLLLPMIEGHDRELRDCVVQILHHLSASGGSEIAEYMQKQQNYRALLKLLDNSMAEEVQIAAAGIIANLPQQDPVTEALVEAEAISILVEVLKTGTPKAKEAAVDALVRFTDPSNTKMQHSVANLDVHSLLVRTMYSGTVKSKARAATALGNFSKSTPSLCLEPETMCSCFGTSRAPKCKVHSGRCSVKTTFCIVEADAVSGLIVVMSEDRGAAAEAAVEALETLVAEDDTLQPAAQLLHNSDGISPLINILTVGTPELKEKAIRFLERIFVAKGMKEVYGNRSRIPLVDLATFGSHSIKKSAAKVLAQLEFIHEVSTYY